MPGMDAAWAAVTAGGISGALGVVGSWMNGRSTLKASKDQAEKAVEAAREQATAAVNTTTLTVGDAAAARAESRTESLEAASRANTLAREARQEQAELDLIGQVYESMLWLASTSGRPVPADAAERQDFLDGVHHRIQSLMSARIQVATKSPSGFAFVAESAAKEAIQALVGMRTYVLNPGEETLHNVTPGTTALGLADGLVKAHRVSRGLDIDAWMKNASEAT